MTEETIETVFKLTAAATGTLASMLVRRRYSPMRLALAVKQLEEAVTAAKQLETEISDDGSKQADAAPRQRGNDDGRGRRRRG